MLTQDVPSSLRKLPIFTVHYRLPNRLGWSPLPQDAQTLNAAIITADRYKWKLDYDMRVINSLTGEEVYKLYY